MTWTTWTMTKPWQLITTWLDTLFPITHPYINPTFHSINYYSSVSLMNEDVQIGKR